MTRVGEAPNIYTVRQQIGELIGLGASRSADDDLKDPTLQPQALDLLARQVHASPEPAIGLPQGRTSTHRPGSATLDIRV